MTTETTTFSPAFSLYTYLTNPRHPKDSVVLGGSATPYLSVADLIALSTDPEKTRQNLTTALLAQPMSLTSNRGSPALRETIAATYAPSGSVSADHVLVANGTTGANHIVERSLLTAGDHVIVQYPTYGPCIEEPLAIGCELSYLRLDASNDWRANPEDLRSLIKPGKTKMIFLNNPGNPTGSYIDSEPQRAIIKIAKEHDIIIHCDEIFRPLFHSQEAQAEMPPSLIEHADLDYDKVVVTSSLSKSYGLSGVRIGWITTRSSQLYSQFTSYRMFSVLALSQHDESVATEALSTRCRPGIVKKHLSLAKTNLDLIDAFANKCKDRVDWTRPTAGAVGFVKFLDVKTGQGRDDVEFCDKLAQSKGILLSPGSVCFEIAEVGQEDRKEFQGRVRLHFTCPTDVLKAGLKGIGEFLDKEASEGSMNTLKISD